MRDFTVTVIILILKKKITGKQLLDGKPENYFIMLFPFLTLLLYHNYLVMIDKVT